MHRYFYMPRAPTFLRRESRQYISFFSIWNGVGYGKALTEYCLPYSSGTALPQWLAGLMTAGRLQFDLRASTPAREATRSLMMWQLTSIAHGSSATPDQHPHLYIQGLAP